MTTMQSARGAGPGSGEGTPNTEAEVVKVRDIRTMTNYGVLTIPGLVVDGVVKVAGKLPSKEEIKKMIQ